MCGGARGVPAPASPRAPKPQRLAPRTGNPNCSLRSFTSEIPDPEGAFLLPGVTLPQVPSPAHASPGSRCIARARRAVPEERARGAPGRVPRAARHSPMRLKLSDKVLRNFFILPIFSAGCGSMRSHIWATPRPATSPNWSRAERRQQRARAARGRRRRLLLHLLLRPGGDARAPGGERQAPLRPGPRPAGRGRAAWCRGRPQSPPRLRAAPPPPRSFSLLCNRERRGRRWRGRCGTGGSVGAGLGQGAGAGGRRGRQAQAGTSSQPRVWGAGRKEPRRGTAGRPALAAPPAAAPPPLQRQPRGAGPWRDLGSSLGARVLRGPVRPAGVPAAPPSGRPCAPPLTLPPRPPARSGARAVQGREPTGAGWDWGPGVGPWSGHRRERG